MQITKSTGQNVLVSMLISSISHFLNQVSVNWNSVFENFIADAATATIFSFFFVWLLNWSKRPRLKLIINLENSTNENPNWATISISNEGRSALKENEIVWHIYWPQSLITEFIKRDKSLENLGESEINGERVSHLVGSNQVPLFPERERSILSFKFTDPDKIAHVKFRYHFSTVIGIMPRWVWDCWRFTKLQDKKGFPKLELLPAAEIRDIRQTSYRNKAFIPPENL